MKQETEPFLGKKKERYGGLAIIHVKRKIKNYGDYK